MELGCFAPDRAPGPGGDPAVGPAVDPADRPWTRRTGRQRGDLPPGWRRSGKRVPPAGLTTDRAHDRRGARPTGLTTDRAHDRPGSRPTVCTTGPAHDRPGSRRPGSRPTLCMAGGAHDRLKRPRGLPAQVRANPPIPWQSRGLPVSFAWRVRASEENAQERPSPRDTARIEVPRNRTSKNKFQQLRSPWSLTFVAPGRSHPCSLRRARADRRTTTRRARGALERRTSVAQPA